MNSLDESFLGRPLEVHVELDSRGLLLVTTRTVGAARGSALLHSHGKYGEENREQSDHDAEQRPQDQVVDVLARLGSQLQVDLVAVDRIAVACERIASQITETGQTVALCLVDTILTE